MTRTSLIAALLGLACSNGPRAFGDAANGGRAGSESSGGVAGDAAGADAGGAGVSGSTDSEAGAGGEAGAGAEAGAGGEAGGGQEPIAASPSVSQVDPPEANPGETVVVRGDHFLPSPSIRLGSRAGIAVESATEDRVTFVVPSDLELDSCSQTLPLVVINDNGSSEPVPFTAELPQPSLAKESDTVAAGARWTLTGEGLTGAHVSLGASVVASNVADASSIELELPRSTPVGNTTLVVSTACGETTIPVQVLPPPPRVISADLTTLEPGAVIMLEVDMSYGATVARAKVGTATIAANDATSFLWVPGKNVGDTQTVAIRIPPQAAPGDLNITLEGAATAADALQVKLIAASPSAPDAAPSLLLPSGEIVGEFPESTAGPFEQALHPNSGGFPNTPWTYNIQVGQAGRSCSQSGTIKGQERHCPGNPVDEHCSVGFATASSPCPAGADVCNPFEGTYTIAQKRALVKLFIDRKSPLGPEEYEGTWSNPDGSPASTSRPYLVLRSKRSGRQLMIVHAAFPCTL